VVVLDDLGLLAEQEPERPRQVAHVERLVVLVQHEHDTVHDGAIVAGGGRSFARPRFADGPGAGDDRPAVGRRRRDR